MNLSVPSICLLSLWEKRSLGDRFYPVNNKQHLITIDRMGATLFTQQLPEISDDNFYFIAVSSARQTWGSNEALGSCFLFRYLEDLLTFLGRPQFIT